MAQRSVVTPTIRPENYQTRAKHQWVNILSWMHPFFTSDISPDSRQTVELQRRATWIGIALILQSANEPDHTWYIPYLKSFSSLIPFGLIAGSFFAMWMAFRPTSLKQCPQQGHGYPRPWQRFILILTLVLAILGCVEFGRGLVLSFSEPQFTNDGASLDTNAAILLLQGRNPYTDSNVLDLARRFPIQSNWTTPLRQGQFANQLDYPTLSEFQQVLSEDLTKGSAPEFESKVSYPALSFLTLVPFVFFKDYNVIHFYLLCYLVLLAMAWKIARPEIRPWVLLLGIANVPMLASAISSNLDVFYTLLILPVWLFRDRRWVSAIFLGLAMASKQISWFFLPFYVILIWRQYGLVETLRRLTISGGLALVINLPFILWNPHAWLAGVLAPMADPMFPLGAGIINLSASHLLPFLPSWMYTALEGMAMLLSLAWYWRICHKHPEAVMLLAILPLFFAWRSLLSYFYCAAFPMLVLIAARNLPGKASQSARSSTPLQTLRHIQPEPVLIGAAAVFSLKPLIPSRLFFPFMVQSTQHEVPEIVAREVTHYGSKQRYPRFFRGRGSDTTCTGANTSNCYRTLT